MPFRFLHPSWSICGCTWVSEAPPSSLPGAQQSPLPLRLERTLKSGAPAWGVGVCLEATLPAQQPGESLPACVVI